MLSFAFLAVIIYSIVMWAFMMGDTLTGYSIPWLDKIAEKLAHTGAAITLALVIAAFGILVYGIATKDPSFVGVIK